MERRDFLKSAVAGTIAAREAAAKKGEMPKRKYRDNVKLSVIGFGGIVVCGMEQNLADRTVAESWDRGINYYDVAPTYFDGEAETKLGIALKPYRKKAFLACKTTIRDAQGAAKELEQSLKRLHTDHFDLYQFHAVSSMEDVEKILAPAGAAELFTRARKDGKVRYLGASAHNAEAAIALMERFPLDSILFPVNFVCFQQGSFGPQILAKAKEKGVARLALKALAHHPWPKGTDRKKSGYEKCWYKPVDDPELARKALRFTLSEDITAAVPPGDERIYAMALDIAAAFTPMTAAERQELLASSQGTAPIFKV
ncbi:MAG TPA: aldo/keto reductase [Bryobacteraceae bacterium]|nr:aldo/keto reductase [Bryobacteraceae bacterium]